MDPLFQPLPDSLSELSDEQLDTQIAEHVATFKLITSNDSELLGDRSAQEILEAGDAGKESYKALKAEKAARAEAVATYEATIEALTSDIEELTAESDETTADEEPELADPEPEVEAVVEEAEVVTAAITPLRRPLPRPARHAPMPVAPDDNSVALVASAGMQGITPGEPLTQERLGLALLRAIQNTTVARSQEKVVVASADYKHRIPEERYLRNNAGNDGKIHSLSTEVALTAAANPYCAPLTPYYTLQNLSVQNRPVRDGLAGFVADRGGITYTPPPALSSITTGVGDVSAAEVVEGGTFSVKTCQTVDCPDIVSVNVYSVYECLKFGNLQSRSYPELIALDNNLAMAAQARLADTLLLDAIKAGSTAVTGAANNGAVNTYLGHLLELAASIRSANRMLPDTRLRVLAPAWIRDLLVLDIARSQFERFAYQQDGIQQLLDMFNLTVTFYIDGSSTGNQVYSTQGAGAITPFPTTVETFMFPEGSWLYLDAGTLDLGIVRDSQLNSTNQFELFAETFEAAAKVGVVSYVIESTVCPSGAVTAPGSAVAC